MEVGDDRLCLMEEIVDGLFIVPWVVQVARVLGHVEMCFIMEQATIKDPQLYPLAGGSNANNIALLSVKSQ